MKIGDGKIHYFYFIKIPKNKFIANLLSTKAKGLLGNNFILAKAQNNENGFENESSSEQPCN